MTNLDSAYNVNAAIQAEKVAERLYYPDRLARLREIEENEIDGDRFTPAEFLKAGPLPRCWMEPWPCLVCKRLTTGAVENWAHCPSCWKEITNASRTS